MKIPMPAETSLPPRRSPATWRQPVAAWLSLLAIAVAVGASATSVGVAASSRTVVAPSTAPARDATPAGAPLRGSGPAADPGPESLTVAFSGDILIHERLWQTAAAHAGGQERFDFRPLLRPARPVVSAADLAICHLETPLSPDDRELSSYPVFETPHELADAIAWAGYDGCSTASNHTLDGGSEGVTATLRWLDRAGVGHAGSARSRSESRRITTYDVRGVRIAHLSYAFGFNGFAPDHPWRANRISVPAILADAARADRHHADLVVVSLHWGTEYTHTPTAWQREVAERLTRSPHIDLIVGHHAHVVQPIARIHGTWVVYGMGNLLSGMTSSLGTPAVEDGVIVVATVTRGATGWRVAGLRYVPTWVEYGTWRVLPIASTLAKRWPSDALRAILRASWARTTAAIHLLGANGVRPLGPLPAP
jgi:poly-gamma-glutamate synthesis protein (capsule biosynthesis protein)